MEGNFGNTGPCVCGFGGEFFTMEGGRPLCTVCGGIVGKQPQEQPAAAGQPRKSVLIVDDQSFFRGRIRLILEEFGHQVLEAASGLEGLKVIADACLKRGEQPPGQIDALILDLVMPGELDGFQTLAAVKSILPHLPVIVLTASPPTKELLDKLAKLGARKYLNKAAGDLDNLILKNIQEI